METKKLKDLSFEALCSIIAKVIHSANKAYTDAIGGRAFNPSWEEAREEQRQGLIKAVASTIVNPLTPSISHEKWCLAREKEGWTKDLKYDFNRKTHPNLVPFDQLPPEEQFKDHLYMGIASIFCGGWGILDMSEVQIARKILVEEFASQEAKRDVRKDEDEETFEVGRVKDEEIDPVDRASTIALKAKLAEAKEKLAAAEDAAADPKPNLPDDENVGIADGPSPISGHDPDNPEPEYVNNGVDKIYTPVMDDEIKETSDVVLPDKPAENKPKPKPKAKKKPAAKSKGK